MAGRIIEDEADANACLAAVQQMGIDIGSWARAHGVDGRSLHAWKKSLARRAAVKDEPTVDAPKLIELVPSSRRSCEAKYVLDLGDARLEFDDGASVETLRRVLQALRTC